MFFEYHVPTPSLIDAIVETKLIHGEGGTCHELVEFIVPYITAMYSLGPLQNWGKSIYLGDDFYTLISVKPSPLEIEGFAVTQANFLLNGAT